MGVLALGLFTGVIFGYILQRSGVSGCGCIFNALELRNMKAVKLMMTAVAVGSLIIYPASALGWVSIGGKTLYVLGVIAGGLIFGTGFALAGYCPGTALAALGAGARQVLWVVAGGLAGSLAYAAVYPVLEPLLIQPANYGTVSLPQVLGTNPVTTGIVFALALLAIVFGIDRWERGRRNLQAVSETEPVHTEDLVESDAAPTRA